MDELTLHPPQKTKAAIPELLQKAMQRNRDLCVLVDKNQDQFIWWSHSFSERFLEYCRSKRASEFFIRFPILVKAFEQLSNSHEDVRDIDTFYSNGGEISLPVSVHILRVEHPIYFLKIVDKSNLVEGSKRYLEDREQLFSMSRTLGVSEMATTLAHELNQPIGTLSNLLEGLRSRLSENIDAQEAIEFALQQTRFASGIINRIRDYTRKKRPNFDTLDIVSLVSESLSLLDWELNRQGIATEFETAADCENHIMVFGDYLMLQQVIVNLLRNAIDSMYGLPGGESRLVLRVNCDEREAHLQISDSGCGLGGSDKDSLFVAFSSTKPTGMGIGLNICRSFVELHQGRVWLEQNPHRGCTAHVHLPLKPH